MTHASQESGKPTVHPGGLVTVAFLKARLDEGSDHLGIFMPLVIDSIAELTEDTFTVTDVKDTLASRHKLAMPQDTLSTLLRRATKSKFLKRDSGLYRRTSTFPQQRLNVTAEKQRIEASQLRLAQSLRRHAVRRGLTVESTEAALEMLFRFLEEEQIGILLGDRPIEADATPPRSREHLVVAEFLRDELGSDETLRSALRGILEGLVLYHAAFLPDTDGARRHFSDLKVFFDSVLVRQALGYEGPSMKILLRETIHVLTASGVRCLVFDDTLGEIRRILAMYEDHMATSDGRRSLRAVPMARHFLTQRYSPSDIREMAAFLDRDTVNAGLRIVPFPTRIAEFTASEGALAARLASPITHDELQPRVVHDVNCIASILTLRHGHTARFLEDARAVFATSSSPVIRNARQWYQDDEHGSGLPPIVHIRALSNLAWLKKPQLCADFKEHELVALCTAALRPSEATWQRFLRHLELLRTTKRLTSDEEASILVSALSDHLLTEAEIDGDPNDADALTLDDIVDRVRATYAQSAEERIRSLSDSFEAKMAALEAERVSETQTALSATRGAADLARRRDEIDERRARLWAGRVAKTLKWSATLVIATGAAALFASHPLHAGWLGVALGLAVAVFLVLELLGILKHVSVWHSSIEASLTVRFRRWLGGDDTIDESGGPQSL